MVPLRPPPSCCWQVLTACQHLPAIRRRQELIPPVWHGLRYVAPSYIHYYNRRSVLTCTASGRGVGIWYMLEVLRLMVCPPVWRSRCIVGLCSYCIVYAGMGQINGNTHVKPCALFCGVGDINCIDGTKRPVNDCI